MTITVEAGIRMADLALIRISEILLDGAKPTKGPAPKREKKPVAAAAEGEESAPKKKAAASCLARDRRQSAGRARVPAARLSTTPRAAPPPYPSPR